MIDLIKKLPPYNRMALQKLCWVLHNTWQYRDTNMMGTRNLSVVFAPFVLGLGRVSELMATLIRFYRFAFSIDDLPANDTELAEIMMREFGDDTPPLSVAPPSSEPPPVITAPPDDDPLLALAATDDNADYDGGGAYDEAYDEQQYDGEAAYADDVAGDGDESETPPPPNDGDDDAGGAAAPQHDYSALSDDELKAQLGTAMAEQDFERCVEIRNELQARGALN